MEVVCVCVCCSLQSLTPWSLCAHHHRKWGQQLMSELNLSLATHGKLPADAVLQLALDLRTLEAVPVVLRAAAKWPDQVGGVTWV